MWCPMELLVAALSVAAVGASSGVVTCSSSVVYGDDVTFDTLVVATGSIMFGKDVTVKGIVAEKDVSLGDNVDVQGDVIAGGAVSVGDDDTIRGSVIASQPVAATAPEVSSWWSECAVKPKLLSPDVSVVGSRVVPGGASFSKVMLGGRSTVSFMPKGCETTIKVKSLQITGDDNNIIIPDNAVLYIYDIGAGFTFNLHTTKNFHCGSSSEDNSKEGLRED